MREICGFPEILDRKLCTVAYRQVLSFQDNFTGFRRLTGISMHSVILKYWISELNRDLRFQMQLNAQYL